MEQNQTITSNGLSIQYTILPTRKEIIERLLKEEKISFDEMWVLIQGDSEIKYITLPPTITWPDTGNPILPWTTCSANKQPDDNK